MKYLNVLLFVFGTSVVARAQTGDDQLNTLVRQVEDAKIEMQTTKMAEQKEYVRLKSDYMDPDWKPGYVVDEEFNREEDELMFRYDVMYDRIEVMRYLEPEKNKIYSFGGQFFIYSDFITADTIPGKGYFEMMNRGHAKLLLRRSLNFVSGTRQVEAYGSEPSKKVKKQLYIKVGDQPARELVKKDREVIIQVFPDKQEALNQHMKKNYKLGIWTDKHVVDIVEFYNTL